MELFHRAAELGSIEAHYSLANMYKYGEGVKIDVKSFIYHVEVAAIGGHEFARHYLGHVERQIIGNMDRAMQHFMIGARAGFDESLKEVGNGYKDGHVTKDDYASTLRAYHVSVNEMKRVNSERGKRSHRVIQS